MRTEWVLVGLAVAVAIPLVLVGHWRLVLFAFCLPFLYGVGSWLLAERLESRRRHTPLDNAQQILAAVERVTGVTDHCLGRAIERPTATGQKMIEQMKQGGTADE